MTPRAKRTLTREAVVSAALRIVDRDGAEALTMRALGRELGVDPMAAYNHVPNKSAVLDGVVEAVWADLELPDLGAMDGTEQLVAIARSMRATLLRHPNALPILATRPNRAEPGFALVESTLDPLLESGVEPLEALAFINAAVSFIIGAALAESGAAGDRTAGTDGEEDDASDDLLETLRQAVSAHDHPNLARVLADADLEQLTGDRIFDTGIDALIGGIHTLRNG